ncbi:MAG: 3-oxoacyl-[acyl-carrier protein] reductase, partial [uncultured Thermomicrobiales bacterium]
GGGGGARRGAAGGVGDRRVRWHRPRAGDPDRRGPDRPDPGVGGPTGGRTGAGGGRPARPARGAGGDDRRRPEPDGEPGRGPGGGRGPGIGHRDAGQQRRVRRLWAVRGDGPGPRTRHDPGQHRRPDAPDQGRPAGDAGAPPGPDPEPGLDRRVPARPADGGLLRLQSLRPLVLGGPCRGAAGHRGDGDGALPRPDRHRVPGAGGDGGIQADRQPPADGRGGGGADRLRRDGRRPAPGGARAAQRPAGPGAAPAAAGDPAPADPPRPGTGRPRL